MSFSEILGFLGNTATSVGEGIGNAATSVGKGIGSAVTTVGNTLGIGNSPTTPTGYGQLAESTLETQLPTASQPSSWSRFMTGIRDVGESPLGKIARNNIKFGNVPIERGSSPEESKYVSLKSKFAKTRGPALKQTAGFELDRYDKEQLDKLVESWKKGLSEKADKNAWDRKQANEQPGSWSTIANEEKLGWNPDDEDWEDYVSRSYFGSVE
jgi:hypothetical protein